MVEFKQFLFFFNIFVFLLSSSLLMANISKINRSLADFLLAVFVLFVCLGSVSYILMYLF